MIFRQNTTSPSSAAHKATTLEGLIFITPSGIFPHKALYKHPKAYHGLKAQQEVSLGQRPRLQVSKHCALTEQKSEVPLIFITLYGRLFFCPCRMWRCYELIPGRLPWDKLLLGLQPAPWKLSVSLCKRHRKEKNPRTINDLTDGNLKRKDKRKKILSGGKKFLSPIISLTKIFYVNLRKPSVTLT